MSNIKVNRGAMRRERLKNTGHLMPEQRLPIEIGMAVRIVSLSLSRLERSNWAGKHGVLRALTSEHGMTMAYVQVKLSSSHMTRSGMARSAPRLATVKVPLSEIRSIEPGREFVPLEENPNSVWNPVRSPFESVRAPAQHAARIDAIINNRRA